MKLRTLLLLAVLVLGGLPGLAQAAACTTNDQCSADQDCNGGECSDIICSGTVVNHVCTKTGTTQTGTAGGTTQTGTAGGTTQTGTAGGTTQTGTAGGVGSGATLQNPLQNINDLPTLLKTILQAVVELGSILLVVMLVWVGFLFVTARGNPEEISKARGALIWTLIGGLILLGAQAIADVIQATVQSL